LGLPLSAKLRSSIFELYLQALFIPEVATLAIVAARLQKAKHPQERGHISSIEYAPVGWRQLAHMRCNVNA
jgi:hypothetical protein